MSEATRDAKLRLTLDSAEAVRGMSEVVRAGERIEQQETRVAAAAEKANSAIASRGSEASAAATRTIERYGPHELTKTEMRRARAEERAAERREKSEVERQLKDEADARSMSRKAMEDARKKRSQAEEAERERAEKEQERAEKKAEADAERQAKQAERKSKHAAERKKSYERFRSSFESEQEVLETAAKNKEAAEAQSALAAAQKRMEEEAKEKQANSLSGRASALMQRAGISPGMGAAAGYAAVANVAVGGLTGILNAGNNTDMTIGQQQRAGLEGIADSIPVLGGIVKGVINNIRGLANAIDGTTERIRQANIRLAEDPQRLALTMRNRSEISDLSSEYLNARHRAGIMDSASVPEMRRFDRSTATGEQAFQDEQQRMPARDAAAAAEREAAIARAAVLVSQQERDQADGQYRSVAGSGRRQAAQSRVDSARSRDRAYWSTNGEQVEAGAELRNALQEESAAAERREALVRRHQQTAVAAVQAESRARQANIQIMQAELQIGQQSEQRMRSNASRLGGMSWIDRKQGIAARLMVETQGVGNVAPHILQQARSVDPEGVDRLTTRFGENTAEYRELQRRGIFQDQGSIEQRRDNNANLQQQVREATLRDQQETARAMSEAVANTLQQFFGVFEERMARLARELTAGRQLNQANQ